MLCFAWQNEYGRAFPYSQTNTKNQLISGCSNTNKTGQMKRRTYYRTDLAIF